MSYDDITSSIGEEASDRTISVSGPLKPHWHLQPLPLSQLNPSATSSRRFPAGRPPSLQSFCLHTISTSFHAYTPSHLSSLPPLLARRVLSRVRADRGHEDHQPEGERAFLPDEATIWAFGAMCLPGEDRGFNLALPHRDVLTRLPPNPAFPFSPHPLTELPKLFLRAPAPSAMAFTLLTSLTLDGTDGSINDTSIQSLRWCTHLAALWTTGCGKLSDAGVKVLASALEPPDRASGEEGRGMWRLRAWYLGGCKRVSDRSAKSFARWPGLVLLDLRDTSCTEAALGIHTRTSSTLFGPTTPAFQPCTDGLVPLFATSLPPADILDSLCLTLIRLPRGDDAEEAVEGARPKMISLNITPAPADRAIPENHLPFPAPSPAPAPSPSGPPSSQPSFSPLGSVLFTADGGTLYGSSVSRVSDEDTTFHQGYSDRGGGGGKIDRRKIDMYASRSNSPYGSGGGGAGGGDFRSGGGRRGYTSGTVYQPRAVTTQAAREREAVLEMGRRGMGDDWWAESTDDHARAFVVGAAAAAASKPAPGSTSAAAVAARRRAALLALSRLSKEEAARGEGAGDRRVMLVRMVDDGWEEQEWVRGGAGGGGGEMGWASGVLRGVKKGRGVEELLGLGGTAGAAGAVGAEEAGGEKLVAGLMGERRSSPPAQTRQPAVSHNPFRAKVTPRPAAAASPGPQFSQASSTPAPPASNGTRAGAAGSGSSAAQKRTFAATAAGVKMAVGPGPSSSSTTPTSTEATKRPANPFARIRPSAKLPTKPTQKAPSKPSMFSARASSLTHPSFANGRAARAGAGAGAGTAGIGGVSEVGRPGVVGAAARTSGRNPFAPKPKPAASSSPAPTTGPPRSAFGAQPPSSSPNASPYPPSSPSASQATWTSSPGFPPSSQPRPPSSFDTGDELPLDAFDAFDAPGKRKRIWGGGAGREEGGRRRGMKMFDASMK